MFQKTNQITVQIKGSQDGCFKVNPVPQGWLGFHQLPLSSTSQEE